VSRRFSLRAGGAWSVPDLDVGKRVNLLTRWWRLGRRGPESGRVCGRKARPSCQAWTLLPFSCKCSYVQAKICADKLHIHVYFPCFQHLSRSLLVLCFSSNVAFLAAHHSGGTSHLG
jgi:hypothetical protein